MPQALNHMGFAQMAREIRTGSVTAEAVVQACIERIEAREAEIGAFVCYDCEAALAAARLADQSEPKGPLHGVPFGIKDIIDTDQFKDLVESGLTVSRSEFVSACLKRDRAARILESLYVDADVILTPAAPGEAPAGLDATGDPLFSRGWNLLQVPCVSIPYGSGPNGLPLSVQLVGRMGADDDLLAAAKWVDQQLNPGT